MQVDFGRSRNHGQRFALWSTLFCAAPDVEVVFPDEHNRDAARNFMDLTATTDEETEF